MRTAVFLHEEIMLLIEMITGDFQGFAETLEMDDLSLPQEAQRRKDGGVIGQVDEIFIGGACLLFGCHILIEIGDGVALGLEIGGGEGDTCGRGGINPQAMIDIIGIQPGGEDLILRQPLGELVDDGTHHFQMRQFLGVCGLS